MVAWRIGVMEAETNYQPSTTATRRHSNMLTAEYFSEGVRKGLD